MLAPQNHLNNQESTYGMQISMKQALQFKTIL